jgi:hypothetical protein
MNEHRRKIWLPVWLMDCIEAIAANPHVEPMDRLAGVVTLLRGWATAEHGVAVSVTSISIPAEQYDRISEMLSAGQRDPRTAANLAIGLADQGPDVFVPE